MKKKGIIGVLLLVAGMALLLVALQLLLNARLNPEIRKALPALQAETGLTLDIGQASVNIFSGHGRAEGLKISKPDPRLLSPALTMDSASLSIAWTPLLHNITRIEDANIPQAELTLLRTPAGRVRIPAATPGQPPPAAPKPSPPTSDSPGPSTEGPSDTLASRSPVLPKFAIRKGQAALRVIYEDQTQVPVLRRIQEVTLQAQDIFTYGDLAPADWGTIHLTGHAAGNTNACMLDLVARVAPVSDPAVASFSLEGGLKNINLAELGTLTEAIGIVSESADITLKATVLDGVFQSDARLILTLRNARLSEKLSKKIKRISLPPLVTIEIPVGGTLEKPVINVEQAILHSVLKTFAANPLQLLKPSTP